METNDRLVTEYDWPEGYVYVPWLVDKLTRDSVSKDRVNEIEKSRLDARRMKGRLGLFVTNF